MKTTKEERAYFRSHLGMQYHTFIWACIDDIEELLNEETGPVQIIEYQQGRRARELAELRSAERRAMQYRHFAVELCNKVMGYQERVGEVNSSPDWLIQLCNLEFDLFQEEKADRKRKR